MIDGLLKPFDGLWTKFKEGLDEIQTEFKKYWGISSPSKKMQEFGGYLVDGLIGGIGDVASRFLGIFGKAKDGITGLISFDKMSELGSNMIDGVVAGLEATPAGMIASKLKEKAGSFFNDGTTAIKVPEIENGDAFLQNSAALIQRINQVADMMQQFSKIYKADLVTHVESVVSEINELNALLSDIEIGDVNSTIDSLNSKLLINNKQIKIENKPININMNLNVQFDALKFTTSVFTVASSATKQDGNSRIANSTNALVTARDNFRAGR